MRLGLCVTAMLVAACSADGERDAARGAWFRGPAIAYQPRGFVPGEDGVTEASIRADLEQLHGLGFRGLTTYQAAGVLAEIPRLARAAGFDGTIVMGIWDPTSAEEFENAQAHARFVDAYCVGNEGLDVRYSQGEAAACMQRLRAATGRPVTTAERIDRYVGGRDREWLLASGDFLFPIAHPYWFDVNDPARAAGWLAAQHDHLIAATDRDVVFREAGFPSAGGRADEKTQLAFFRALEKTGLPVFQFEAYDQPWKGDGATPEEAHWGLLRADGTPKPVAGFLRAHRGAR